MSVVDLLLRRYRRSLGIKWGKLGLLVVEVEVSVPSLCVQGGKLVMLHSQTLFVLGRKRSCLVVTQVIKDLKAENRIQASS